MPGSIPCSEKNAGSSAGTTCAVTMTRTDGCPSTTSTALPPQSCTTPVCIGPALRNTPSVTALDRRPQADARAKLGTEATAERNLDRAPDARLPCGRDDARIDDARKHGRQPNARVEQRAQQAGRVTCATGERIVGRIGDCDQARLRDGKRRGDGLPRTRQVHVEVRRTAANRVGKRLCRLRRCGPRRIEPRITDDEYRSTGVNRVRIRKTAKERDFMDRAPGLLPAPRPRGRASDQRRSAC